MLWFLLSKWCFGMLGFVCLWLYLWNKINFKANYLFQNIFNITYIYGRLSLKKNISLELKRSNLNHFSKRLFQNQDFVTYLTKQKWHRYLLFFYSDFYYKWKFDMFRKIHNFNFFKIMKQFALKNILTPYFFKLFFLISIIVCLF